MDLPTLRRDFTGQSVRFLTEIYCYSLLAYLPDLLGAIEDLENAGYCLPVPCLARNLLEWTANAGFLNSKLDVYKIRKNDSEMIGILEQLLAGNLWISNQYKHVPIPKPIRSSKVIDDYVSRPESEFGDSDAKDSYGMLCELTHANGMALTHYQVLVGSDMVFKREDHGTFNERVNIDTISILVFIFESLSAVRETLVSKQLLRIIKSIAEQNDFL